MRDCGADCENRIVVGRHRRAVLGGPGAMKERVLSLQRAANDPRQHVGDHVVVCLVAGMKQTLNCRVANMMSSASREGISHQEFHLPNRGNRDRQVFVSSCRSQTCLRVGSESLTSMGQMPRGIGDTAVAHFEMRYEVQYQRINYSTSLSHWRLSVKK